MRIAAGSIRDRRVSRSRKRRPTVAGVTALALTISILAGSQASCGKAAPPRPAAIAKTGAIVKAPTIQVFVTKLVTKQGPVKYAYRVVNGSTFPIVSLLVGYDDFYAQPQLVGEPLGWDGDTIPPS